MLSVSQLSQDSSDLILVRPLISADVTKIRDLHTLLLPMRYPSSFFTQLLLLPSRICFVACQHSNPTNPVAFISACVQKALAVDNATFLARRSTDERLHPPPSIEILTLGVLPAFQKRGLGSLLVRRVYQHFCETLQDLKDGIIIQANVATSNASAISFYNHMGMRIVSGVIYNLYRACTTGSRDGYVVAGFLHF